MQMTIRGIGPELRAALEKRAREQNKSLNQVILDDLMRAEGLAERGDQPKRDLSFMVGTPEDIRALEEAEAECERIFPEEWK